MREIEWGREGREREGGKGEGDRAKEGREGREGRETERGKGEPKSASDHSTSHKIILRVRAKLARQH